MRLVVLMRVLVIGGLAAVMLGAASGASACFPLPLLTVEPQSSGVVGARVTIEGVDFGEGPTEVRWNAIDGPILGRGSADSFMVAVTIPAAGDGVYGIVALARRVDGSVGVKAVTPFLVTSGGGSTGPGSLSSPERSSAAPASSSTGWPVGVIVGGLAVLVIGSLGGVVLVRRRRRD